MSPIRRIAAIPPGIPPQLASALGAARGWLTYRTRASERRRVDDGLRQAFADLESSRRQRLCRETFVAAGRGAWELGVARRWQAQRLCRRLNLQNWQRLVEAEDRGCGVVLVVPPMVYWPLVPLAIGLYRGPVDMLGSPGREPDARSDFDTGLRSWATHLASEPLLAWGSDANSDVLSTLRRGGRVVAPLGPAMGDDAINLPFLGGQVRVSRAIAQAARETAAPLVPVFAESAPEAGRAMFRIVVQEPLESRKLTPEELMQQALRAVEQEILRQPQLWLGWSGSDIQL